MVGQLATGEHMDNDGDNRCDVCETEMAPDCEHVIQYTQQNVVDMGTYYDYEIVVSCSVCNEVLGTEKPVNPFAGVSADLGNSLTLKFVLNPQNLVGNDNYAIITRFYSNGTTQVSDPIAQTSWGSYNATLKQIAYENIAGKEMTDVMQIQIFNADGKPVSVIWKDSIRSYTMRMIDSTIAKYQATPTAKLKNQITAMVELLNYGAAAQSKFGYNTGDLANNQLTAEHLSYAIATQTAENVFQRDTVYCAGANMVVESRLKYNFVFYKNKLEAENVAYAIVTYTSHSGSKVETRIEYSEFENYNASLKSVPVITLAAADGDQVITCTLYDANGNVITTASDTMNSYLSRNSSKDAVFNAILKYTRASYAYFHP